MTLSDLSIRRPVLAAVVAILLSIAGLAAFFDLSVREYPNIDPPVVSIETSYTGASASVIESRITQLLESRLSGIDGVETITSSSSDGSSRISVEFTPGSDIDAAANDIRDRISSAAENLPAEAQPPETTKIDADNQPIMFFSVRAPGWSIEKLADFVDRVVLERLSTINGVARVQMLGGTKPAMRVWLDARRLVAFGMTPTDVEVALRRQNVELPAGRIEAKSQNVTMRMARNFTSPEDFRALVISKGGDGYLVRLGDVARVEIGPESFYNGFHYNGERAVGLGITKQSDANTLDVAARMRAAVRQLNTELPDGVRIYAGGDSSLFIDRAINSVWHALIEAAVLVVAVILLFLGSVRATIIPALTVPVCLLCAMLVLWLCGYSINLLTLLALVLAIGLVVDDAIVVLENVHRRIELGESPLVAAFQGSRQVAFAVLSTTLVVCAVFVPIMFIPGQAGLLFRELAAAMIGAIAFSGFLALTLAPMLCSKLLRKEKPSRIAGRIAQALDRVESVYSAMLVKAMARPLSVFAAVVGLMVAAGLAWTTIESELAPGEDTGIVQVRLATIEGTGFDQLEKDVRTVEKGVAPLKGKGAVRGWNARYGGSDDFNTAQLNVFLKPWEQRSETSGEIATKVNRAIAEVPGVRGNASVPSALGRGRGDPVAFVLAGSDYAQLALARDRILDAARSYPGLVNLDADYVETKPQLLIDVDSARAGDLGVSVSEIGQALQTMMGSRRASSFVQNGKEYYVIVQADRFDRMDEHSLDTVHVRAQSGALVPLSSLVRTRSTASASELGRFNKMRAITLTAGLAPGYTLGTALGWLEQQAKASPEVLQVGYRGESQSYRQTGSSIWLVFGLTIVIVYLLLAAQFESFLHPLIVIATVPMGLAGGILGLGLTGNTLNLYSQVGIIMLVGLAAKNGILIVEFANQLRDDGMDFAEAIHTSAVRRLRPILMTSLATVMGAMPLMLASGAGAHARQSIGAVVVFGVSIATIVTLFLIPLLYRQFCRRSQSPQAVSQQLSRAIARQDAPINLGL
ncbi:multidrug efflux pump [Novosphingobium kunmingense]|uniref:Multidrug efflux pump n=1 Tax=Novosphingobium kunmingense TaxID=1211806 RepID=A0A2N0HJA8_9SPHN|nr:efflux RND transporter permease subunit [Novosphingobium kunmingense]PKB19037.1 multidrug efflux pump [Novosphingobium kunmingense]